MSDQLCETCNARLNDADQIEHQPDCPMHPEHPDYGKDPAPPETNVVELPEATKPVLPDALGYDLIEPKPESIEHCARIVHAAVEAMNRAHNETTLTYEQSRDSIISGIYRTLDNPFETPEQNHQAWLDYKTAEGWKYGPIKDAEAKTHPCMVPYAALGPFQQSKDHVFSAIVRTYFGL